MFDRLRDLLGMKADLPEEGSSIRVASDGFYPPSSNQKIRWQDIAWIRCFKRDLLTTDLVCIEVSSKVEEACRVTLNEEMAGFDEFCVAVAKIIPDEYKDWRRNVVLPAFATNELVIYRGT